MDTKKYKLGIAGLGPVGMILAVNFKQAGCNVVICDTNKTKVNLIKNEGIKLIDKTEYTTFFDYITMNIDEMLDYNIDMLISCVKTFRVDKMLQILIRRNADFYILSAQNGIDIGLKYTQVLSESKILRMVVNFAGKLLVPNTVKETVFNPPHYIGSINDTCKDVAEWIAGILTFRGQETVALNSFRLNDEVWKKTILISCISPLCGISGLTIEEALKSSDTIEVIEQTILEGMNIAKYERIKFDDNFVKLCLRYLKNAGAHFPSLGVDILAGGETEIDYINGKIVEYGRKHYIQTPLNLTFTNLVNAVTKKNLNGFAASK